MKNTLLIKSFLHIIVQDINTSTSQGYIIGIEPQG